MAPKAADTDNTQHLPPDLRQFCRPVRNKPQFAYLGTAADTGPKFLDI